MTINRSSGVDTTPQKKRLGSTYSASNFSSDSTRQRDSRYKDAYEQRKERLLMVSNIARCALPWHSQQSTAVTTLAAKISKTLDSILEAEPECCANPDGALKAAEECRDWMTSRLTKKSASRQERKLYPAHAGLLRFIAYTIESLGAENPAGCPKRFILPCASDKKPTGADEDIRTDGALYAYPDTSEIEQDERPDCKDILLMSESKWLEREQGDAYDQVLRYTRHIYAHQPNRRFAWGVTICSTFVRIVMLTNDRILSSGDMDIADPAGRAAYIEFIVSLCYCDSQKLGYDPTIAWSDELGCWKIQCPDSEAPASGIAKFVTYYANDPVFESDRLFGRHTRGFLATRDPTMLDRPDTFIKDAWPHASRNPENTSRDELKIMRVIEETLGRSAIDSGNFVKAVCGGIVDFSAFRDPRPDDSDNMLDPVMGDVEDAIQKALPEDTIYEDDVAPKNSCAGRMSLRVHRRMALQPVGQPLHTLKSPYELIVVLADAMDAHSKILQKCGYLHRDISTNNILVVQRDGRARGMLIDFDCAINPDDPREVWSERTGTLPFMSIGNLLKTSVQKSELDDWESLLYVVCWLGVHGISKDAQVAYRTEIKTEHKDNESFKPPLEKWEVGTFEQVANAKKADLETPEIFEKGVLQHFQEGPAYDMLKDMARALCVVLFFHPGLDRVYSGVFRDGRVKNDILDILRSNKVSTNQADPFEKRLEKRKKISSDLNMVANHFRDLAIAALDEQQTDSA
ncbi:hypothetical protein IWW50_000276 [Coemansia erecta]|nr:hypothetical protein GGF43_000411 [Coemansia sp. RSA 2618]KAJ2830457.1 hypothetical protein IWW50_000276 [Coemansia erecta]